MGETEEKAVDSWLPAQTAWNPSHGEGRELSITQSNALRVSAQAAALQVTRILAACRQQCLLSPSTVQAKQVEAGSWQHSLPGWSRAPHLLTLLPPGKALVCLPPAPYKPLQSFEAQTLAKPLSSYTGKNQECERMSGDKHCFKIITTAIQFVSQG